ncbi:MAG TPA: carboxypeptidase-like regulatory domain-containing protein [Chloroflexia bacterium]|jgi:hypothetical protein
MADPTGKLDNEVGINDVANKTPDDAPPSFEIEGTVYEGRTKARIANSAVRASNEDGEVTIKLTDDDGDFKFTGLAPGTWTLTVLSDKYSNTKPVTVNLLDKNLGGISLYIREVVGTVNEQVGKRFLKFISALFGVLVISYVLLHIFFPPPVKPLSHELTTLVKQARDEANKTPSVSDNLALTNTLTLMKNTLETVVAEDPKLINAPVQTIISNTIGQVQELIKANKKADAVRQLESLEAQVSAPQPRGFFWVDEPWRFLEIALWGLAGVLVHLILSSGNYLRFKQFYEEGIYLHSAVLIVMPIIALVVVLLLALITINVTISGGNEVVLDLSDPRILAVVSFLIGSRPFESVKILNRAARFIDKNDNTTPQ